MVILAALLLGEVYSQGFEAKGTVKISGPGYPHGSEANFEYESDGCNWRVVIHPIAEGATDPTEVIYDGDVFWTRTSYVNRLKNSKETGAKSANPVKPVTTRAEKGKVYRNVFAPEVGMIWLTFGSGCYFKSLQPGDLAEPPWVSDELGPIHLRSSVPMYRVHLEADPQSKLVDKIQYFRPSDSSATNRSFAEYKVLSQKTIENTAWPSESILRTYKQGDTKRTVHTEYKLTINSINPYHKTTISTVRIPGPNDPISYVKAERISGTELKLTPEFSETSRSTSPTVR